MSYDNKNALEQIRYSQVPVLSEYGSIFSSGYSGVSDCGEWPLWASVTKEPPQLRWQPQVVLSVMRREFRALTLWREVFSSQAIRMRHGKGKRDRRHSVFRQHPWFVPGKSSLWVAPGEYCCEMLFGNVYLDVCQWFRSHLCLLPEFCCLAWSGKDCFKVVWGKLHGNEIQHSYQINSALFSPTSSLVKWCSHPPKEHQGHPSSTALVDSWEMQCILQIRAWKVNL